MAQGQQEIMSKIRTVLGKKVRALRRQGLTPANIYGHGVESRAIQLPTPAIKSILHTAGRRSVLNLRVEGESAVRPVIIRQVQHHPMTDEILHVDFYQVSLTEEMTVGIPLVFVGEAPAVKTLDAVLIQSLDTVSVKCLPQDIPREIEVDVSGLEEIDDAIHVADLQVPPKVHLLTNPELVVVKAAAPTVEVVGVAAEEAVAEVEEVEEAGETEEE